MDLLILTDNPDMFNDNGLRRRSNLDLPVSSLVPCTLIKVSELWSRSDNIYLHQSERPWSADQRFVGKDKPPSPASQIPLLRSVQKYIMASFPKVPIFDATECNGVGKYLLLWWKGYPTERVAIGGGDANFRYQNLCKSSQIVVQLAVAFQGVYLQKLPR